MSATSKNVKEDPHRIVKLSRLEALGDAIFAFALTLLALEIRLPEILPNQLIQAIIELLPKLLVFIFAFLVIAQEWDVHQRTMMHIDHADGIFVWLYLLSLMFVVLMPLRAKPMATSCLMVDAVESVSSLFSIMLIPAPVLLSVRILIL